MNTYEQSKATPQEVKAATGATHYSGGEGPGMYYKYDPEVPHRLEYLSYCGLWQASAVSGYADRVEPAVKQMTEIK
jgi:hypothetical protein